MRPSPPDLAIVIVNWNTRSLLCGCLAEIPAAVAGCSAEVWVVDNGSSDGSVEAVRATFPGVQVIANEHNSGFAAANNQAIRASESRHVLLLNSDTMPRPGSLAAIAGFLDAHRTVAFAGPRLLNADGSAQLSYASFPSLSSELTGRNFRRRRPFSASPSEAYAVDWVGGACLMARREALATIGLLDEGYFMYTEEADWCYRAHRAGWEVCYLPRVEVVHLGGQSSRMASARMKAELYKSKLRFFRKHYGVAATLALALALQAGFLGKAALGGAMALAPPGRERGQALARDSWLMVQALGGQLGLGAVREAY